MKKRRRALNEETLYTSQKRRGRTEVFGVVVRGTDALRLELKQVCFAREKKTLKTGSSGALV